MPMAAFDTMRVAKRLQTEFDVPRKQAEGFASVLHENFVGNVATKEDLARTEEKLGGESAAVRKDVEHLEERLTAKIDGLATRIDGLATKAELAARTDGLATKAELAARTDGLATRIDGLATKAELAARIDGLATKAELAARTDGLATKAELADLGKEIFRTMLVTSVAIVGLTVALIKFLP